MKRFRKVALVVEALDRRSLADGGAFGAILAPSVDYSPSLVIPVSNEPNVAYQVGPILQPGMSNIYVDSNPVVPPAAGWKLDPISWGVGN